MIALLVRRLSTALAVAAVMSVSSCASTEASPRPTSTVEAHVTNGQPALNRSQISSRAESTYRKYLANLATVWNARGSNLGLNRSLASAQVVTEDEQALKGLAEKDRHLSGHAEVRAFKAQRFDQPGQKLLAYVCSDSSAVKVLDEAGKDVTPRSRVDLQTTLVTFGVRGADVIVEKNGKWAGDSIC